MKLEDQVCSLELAKRLKKLGVKQESAFYWVTYRLEKKWELKFDWESNSHSVSAFTVAELGEMLPSFISTLRRDSETKTRWRVWEKLTDEYAGLDSETEAEARAKMLIHLIEKGIVKP